MTDIPAGQTGNGLQTRLFRSLDDPAIAAAAWNDLLARSDTNTVFQTHEWITSWWQIFGAGRSLRIIAVFDRHRLVGLAPLMEERGEPGTTLLRFIGDGNSDYCDFLLAEPRLPVLRQIVAALAEQRGRWRTLRLNNIPQRSFTAQNIRPLCAEVHLMPLIRQRIDCPTLVFDPSPARAESVLRKSSLRRPSNYFRAHGKVEFTELTSVDQALSLLPVFFEQHQQRWRGTGSPSLFTDPRVRDFYRVLLERLLPTGWLVFSVVTFDDRPLAFHFGFDYDRRYYWYKPSFDIGHRQHSPGNLLLRFLLQRALERNCREFDFTIGNEEFKRRYSNTLRRNLCLDIFSRRPAYLISRLLAAAKTQMKRVTRHQP